MERLTRYTPEEKMEIIHLVEHSDLSVKQTLAELRQVVRKLSRLLEISVTLNSTLDPKRLLSYILETATDVLECEGASIMLYDDKRGELFFTAATPSDAQEMAKIPVPLEGSIAGTSLIVRTMMKRQTDT